jgi:predicted DNA-binding transcriptional regulator YafY
MPANKNALTRYALLDKLLSNKRKNYSIQDMTDYLASELPNYGQTSVSRRQVEKDLHYLEDDSPFDVEFERYKVDSPTSTGDGIYKKPCIRYADPSFSIFKKPLTDDELSLLSSVLSSLGSFKGLPNFEWLDGLASKLNLKEQPEIISISKNIKDNSTFLAELFGYISSKSPIRIEYKEFGSDENLICELSPYLLKEYNRRWYLIAYSFDKNKIFNYALDRIKSIRGLDTMHKYKPAPADFTERYEDIIGVTYYEDKPIERITFWVSAASKDYIDTKPIHDSMRKLKGESAEALQNKYPELQDGMFCTIDCIENYELIRELTTFGANLIVLSPLHIAEKVVDIAKKMVAEYNKFLPQTIAECKTNTCESPE